MLRVYDVHVWGVSYVQVLRDLDDVIPRRWEARDSRLGPTRDLGVCAFLSDWAIPFERLPGRGGSAEFARLEQLLYIAGTEPVVLGQAFPRYRALCEEDGQYHGAYGPRLWAPTRRALRLLRDEPDTRRAVISIWEPGDLALAGHAKDVPCTLSLVPWLRGGTLNMAVTMRSCDAWLGLYYDLPAFSCYHRMLALAGSWDLGRLWLTTHSLHLYEKDAAKVEHVGARPIEDYLLLAGPATIVSHDIVERWEEIALWASGELEDYKKFTQS